jgi:heme-degrading monooxygenase HmoA
MFMRITWGRIKPGQWEEYEQRFEKLAAAQLSEGGPMRRWLVRDLDEPDAGFAISVFDTEEQMRTWSSDPAARERTKSEMSDLYIGEYRARQCEVRLQLDASNQK